MRDARALTLNIKRNALNNPYSILMTTEEDVSFSDVMKMGCNDSIIKPIDPKELHEKIENARRLKALFDKLSDTDTDFPSMGGVISKSAFHQLVLSAMERGGRYNELAFILKISVSNYDEIKKMDGDYHATYSVSKVAQHMVRLSRQSDIIGQTGINEYSILLQRTRGHQEATNAAKRFAAMFDEIDDFLPSDGNPISIDLHLMHLPTGTVFFDHSLEKTLSIPSR
jgi:FixJ family two-component response regulator